MYDVCVLVINCPVAALAKAIRKVCVFVIELEIVVQKADVGKNPRRENDASELAKIRLKEDGIS